MRSARPCSSAPIARLHVCPAAADHGFVDGAQHTRAYAFRQSPYDTTLFFLQTDAAAAARPLGAAALERVERAMASCTPTEEDLAQVELLAPLNLALTLTPSPRPPPTLNPSTPNP